MAEPRKALNREEEPTAHSQEEEVDPDLPPRAISSEEEMSDLSPASDATKDETYEASGSLFSELRAASSLPADQRMIPNLARMASPGRHSSEATLTSSEEWDMPEYNEITSTSAEEEVKPQTSEKAEGSFGTPSVDSKEGTPGNITDQKVTHSVRETPAGVKEWSGDLLQGVNCPLGERVQRIQDAFCAVTRHSHCHSCLQDKKNQAPDILCVDCDRCFCFRCSGRHKSTPSSSNHTMLPANDDHHKSPNSPNPQSPPSHPPKAVLTCPAHPGVELGTFCRNCEVLACSECLVEGHPQCPGKVPLHVYASEERDEVKRYRVKYAQVMRFFSEQRRDTEERMAALNLKKQTTQEEIRKFFSGLIKACMDMEGSLLEDLETTVSDHVDLLTEQRYAWQTLEKGTQELLDMTDVLHFLPNSDVTEGQSEVVRHDTLQRDSQELLDMTDVLHFLPNSDVTEGQSEVVRHDTLQRDSQELLDMTDVLHFLPNSDVTEGQSEVVRHDTLQRDSQELLDMTDVLHFLPNSDVTEGQSEVVRHDTLQKDSQELLDMTDVLHFLPNSDFLPLMEASKASLSQALREGESLAGSSPSEMSIDLTLAQSSLRSFVKRVKEIGALALTINTHKTLTLRKVSTMSFTTAEDKTDPLVSAMLLLSPNLLLAADFNNSCLKRFVKEEEGEGWNCTEVLALKWRPYGLTKLSETLPETTSNPQEDGWGKRYNPFVTDQFAAGDVPLPEEAEEEINFGKQMRDGMQSCDTTNTEIRVAVTSPFTGCFEVVMPVSGHMKMYVVRAIAEEKGFWGLGMISNHRLAVCTIAAGRSYMSLIDTTSQKSTQRLPMTSDTTLIPLVSPRHVLPISPSSIIVGDHGKKAVVHASIDGKVLFNFIGNGSQRVSRPEGLCVDSQGHIYVADSGDHSIFVLNKGGHLYSRTGSQQSDLDHPQALCMDRNSCLYVANEGGKVLSVYEVFQEN
ncbi:hypothetical protein ACOMHN_000440 [Nucella lapillus]